jgi:hypothetical protein
MIRFCVSFAFLRVKRKRGLIPARLITVWRLGGSDAGRLRPRERDNLSKAKPEFEFMKQLPVKPSASLPISFPAVKPFREPN